MPEEHGYRSGNVDDRRCDITYSSKGVKRVMLEVGHASSDSAVLVVGGGVAGMNASLTLAEAGVKVFLVDSSPTCGGLVTLLDRTFPTANCGVCNMAISEQAYCPMIEVSRHPLITLMTDSRVKSVQGVAGNFTVTVAQKGEYVLQALCDSCGECEEACPVQVDVPAHTGMLPHKAIYRPGHRSLPGVFALDESACDRCGKCVEACPRGAINLNAKPCDVEVSVSAVIAGPGLGHYDPRTRREYGYGRTENVITGLELERLISPSGPTGGRLVLGPDRRIPQRVAFVQCIGSRDRAGEIPYCSAVCCMYAIKEAMKLKELMPDAVVKVFFVDIRACGKGFEEYYEKAKGLGVEFVPCRVSCIEPEDQRVHVVAETDGAVSREEFDLAVLSTGLTPPGGIDELSQALGIEKGLFGYLGSDVTGPSPVATEREGIYVCGGGVEPQDIPTAIMWSGACAFHALKDAMAEAETSCAQEASPPRKPRPMQISDEVEDGREADEERLGVFVCRCKSSMDCLDIDKIVKWAKEQDQVVTAMEIPDMCMDGGIEALQAAIQRDPVDRVIIAGCSPRDVALVVEERLREVGIRKGLLEVANIREQCAWPHRGDESATRKAVDLVAMAIEQARHGKPLARKARPVREGALVVGGGIAGMRAAKALAELGHQVHLVEKAPVLGGRARQVKRSLSGMDLEVLVSALSEEIRQDPLIKVHVSSEISCISRVDGGFQARIQSREPGSESPAEEIESGAVILATGGTQSEAPGVFTRRVASGVVTQTEFETQLDQAGERLEDFEGEIRSVVMIQCAGSRDSEKPYCSRVCCLQALKNAIRIKAHRPETEVYVLHRDIRAPGFNELFYEQARDMGVVFIRYPENAVPAVLPDDDGKPVRVEAYDEGLGELLHIPADLVVLSVGVEGSGDADLASGLGIGFDKYGFYAEADIKSRPVDFLTPGVYVCGTARAPTTVREALISAEAAAVRAAVRLRRGEERSKENTSNVRARLCRGCGICVEVCPYDARSLDDDLRIVVVDEFRCQGCGACQVACPGGASEHLGFEALRLMAALDAAVV